MGNLGWYQLMTTAAKKVGGPKRLFALILGGGAALGGGAVIGCGAIKSKIAQELNKKKQEEAASVVYTVRCEGNSNEGLLFEVGEQFKILETDGDAGLIEKLGDANSPYFVSLRFLQSISNYEPT